MKDNEELETTGCPNPFSIAENIEGKRINWSKKKDEYDSLAACFGVTKEGFMNNMSLFMRPFSKSDAEDATSSLSEVEAEGRLEEVLKKYARPERKKKSAPMKTMIGTQRRKRVINFLMRKQEPEKVVEKKIKSGELDSAISNDDVFMPEGYVWKDKGYFFNETVHWYDICQRSIGDCYFLAALCSVAYAYPFWIKNVAVTRYKWGEGIQDESPWHAIDFYVPENGYESTTVWGTSYKKTTQTVVVSDEILVSASTGRNYGVCGPKEMAGGSVTANKANLDSCWPAIYEKAYSKFLEKCTSDYPNMLSSTDALIHGGRAESSLKELLHTDQVNDDVLANLTEDKIFQLAQNAKNYPTCASIYSAKVGTSADYLKLGLYTSHAYSILYGITVNGKRYIVIRNPHASNPQALKDNPDVYQNSYGFNWGANPINSYRSTADVYNAVDVNTGSTRANGVFMMEVSAFKKYFSNIEYYTGPIFNLGKTDLRSEYPISKVKLTNNGSFYVRMSMEYRDPDTGKLSVVESMVGNLSRGGSKIVDLTKISGLKSGARVKFVTVAVGGSDKTSRSFFYHDRGDTVNFTVSGDTSNHKMDEV